MVLLRGREGVLQLCRHKAALVGVLLCGREGVLLRVREGVLRHRGGVLWHCVVLP